MSVNSIIYLQQILIYLLILLSPFLFFPHLFLLWLRCDSARRRWWCALVKWCELKKSIRSWVNNCRWIFNLSLSQPGMDVKESFHLEKHFLTVFVCAIIHIKGSAAQDSVSQQFHNFASTWDNWKVSALEWSFNLNMGVINKRHRRRSDWNTKLWLVLSLINKWQQVEARSRLHNVSRAKENN